VAIRSILGIGAGKLLTRPISTTESPISLVRSSSGVPLCPELINAMYLYFLIKNSTRRFLPTLNIRSIEADLVTMVRR